MRKELNVIKVNDEQYTITTIGNLKVDTEGWLLESKVEMSEKNFRKLLHAYQQLLPAGTTNEYNFVKLAIKHLKDKLTGLQYKTTAELSVDLYAQTLEEELDELQYMIDIVNYSNNMPKIVGKVDLDKRSDNV